MKLFTNLSELEDRQLLDAVQMFEKGKLDADKAAKIPDILRSLEAIASYDRGDTELKTEIERLRADNERLRREITQGNQRTEASKEVRVEYVERGE